jgi:NAD-dependent deacetylase
MVTPDLDTVAKRLREARRVTILTGAGVSAPSGVPTFRGAAGLWRSFRADELATPRAFARDPQLVWEWYDWRRQLIAACEPNAAHAVIAKWSQRTGFTLVTQNVDGLHERAGTHAVVTYHGSIWRLRCINRCSADWEDRTVPLMPLPPQCPSCGSLARPAVVWFGESIPPEAAGAAQQATACDVFLSVGTSSVVSPAAGLLYEARSRGAWTVEINPEPTGSAGMVDVAIAMGAESALPLIDERLA